MALAIDASTPVVTSVANLAANGTQASAAFSPPANSLIVAFIALDGIANVTQTVSSVTNSGTVLSWSNQFNGVTARSNTKSTLLGGCAEVWWAYNTNAQSNITVTLTATAATSGGSAPDGVMQVVVFTGAAVSQTGAVNTNSASSSTAAPSQSLTTTTDNSWVMGVIENFSNATAPTVGTNQTVSFNGQNAQELNATTGDSYWAQRQNATTPTHGTSVTINDTAPSILFNMVVVEIIPGNPPANPVRPVIPVGYFFSKNGPGEFIFELQKPIPLLPILPVPPLPNIPPEIILAKYGVFLYDQQKPQTPDHTFLFPQATGDRLNGVDTVVRNIAVTRTATDSLHVVNDIAVTAPLFTASSTINYSTTNIGDEIIIFIDYNRSDAFSTSLSGSRVAWDAAALVSHADTNTSTTLEIWRGVVTSVGSDTTTISFNPGGSGGSIEETTFFQLHTNAATQTWSIVADNFHVDTSGTTINYPSLTSNANDNQVYLGYATTPGVVSAGSTPGFTYTRSPISTMAVVNANLAANTTYAPTASDAGSTVDQTVAVIIATPPNDIATRSLALPRTSSDTLSGTDSAISSVASASPVPRPPIPPELLLAQYGEFLYEQVHTPTTVASMGSIIDSKVEVTNPGVAESDTESWTNSIRAWTTIIGYQGTAGLSLPRTGAENLSGTDSAVSLVTHATPPIPRIPPDLILTNFGGLWIFTETPRHVQIPISFNRAASDTLSGIDSATQNVVLGRTASDILNGTDAGTRTDIYSRNGSETMVTADTATRAATFSRTASDVLSGTDAATRTLVLARTASDILNGVDSAVQQLVRGAVPLPIPPIEFLLAGKYGLIYVHPPIPVHSFTGTATDALNGIDSATQNIVLARTSSDTLSGTDAGARTDVYTRNGAESIVTADTATRIVTFSRTTSDILNGTDSGTRTDTYSRNGSESIVTADTATRVITFSRTTSDILNGVDAATQNVILARNGNDNLNGVDSATRTLSLLRTGSEVLSGVDAATRAAQAFTRTASDILNGIDTATAQKVSNAIIKILPPVFFFKLGALLFELQKPATGNIQVALTASDILSGVDNATRTLVLARSGADNASGVDSATQNVVLTRTTSDILSGVDTATRTLVLSRTGSDILSGTDTGTRTDTYSRNGSESIITSDTATRVETLSRSAADILSGTDVATQNVVLSRTASDNLSGVDIATGQMGASAPPRPIPAEFMVPRIGLLVYEQRKPPLTVINIAAARTSSDILSGTDTATRQLSEARSGAENLNGVDTGTQNITVARSSSDILSGIDAGTRQLSTSRTTSDSASGVDSATRAAISLSRSSSDILSGLDTATKVSRFSRTVADILSGTDNASGALGKARSCSDVLGAIDAATRTLRVGRTAADLISGNDSAGNQNNRFISDSLNGIDALTAPFTLFHPGIVPVSLSVVDQVVYIFTTIPTTNITAPASTPQTVIQPASTPFVVIQ